MTTKLLGPLTKILLNVALNSGPCLKWMLSKKSGSSGTVLKPSPRSPTVNPSRNLLISSRMHFSGFGKLREHVVIDDAESTRQARKANILFQSQIKFEDSFICEQSEGEKKRRDNFFSFSISNSRHTHKLTKGLVAESTLIGKRVIKTNAEFNWQIFVAGGNKCGIVRSRCLKNQFSSFISHSELELNAPFCSCKSKRNHFLHDCRAQDSNSIWIYKRREPVFRFDFSVFFSVRSNNLSPLYIFPRLGSRRKHVGYENCASSCLNNSFDILRCAFKRWQKEHESDHFVFDSICLIVDVATVACTGF